MIRRLAAGVSARSRRRKLDLFLEDKAGSANFFESLYPWPERITAVSTHGRLLEGA